MAYIKQKNANVYVVNIQGYENNLNNHPCMATGLFEVVEGEVPENYERLNFSLGEE